MSEPAPPERNDRRAKLVGRLMVAGLLILVLIYLAPLLISQLRLAFGAHQPS